MKDKVVGKVEEIKGKLAQDKAEEIKGKARQRKGDVQRTVRHAADDLRDLTEPSPDRHAARH
jgi:uncharacterized protein YjbJ (UPF0337 family)